jgi:hypothetical protein
MSFNASAVLGRAPTGRGVKDDREALRRLYRAIHAESARKRHGQIEAGDSGEAVAFEDGTDQGEYGNGPQGVAPEMASGVMGRLNPRKALCTVPLAADLAYCTYRGIAPSGDPARTLQCFDRSRLNYRACTRNWSDRPFPNPYPPSTPPRHLRDY